MKLGNVCVQFSLSTKLVKVANSETRGGLSVSGIMSAFICSVSGSSIFADLSRFASELPSLFYPFSFVSCLFFNAPIRKSLNIYDKYRVSVRNGMLLGLANV